MLYRLKMEEVHTKYYITNIGIKDYNVIIDGTNFFDQPIKMIWKHMITLE